MATQRKKDTVEDYRRGYPRLAAFMSVDDNFMMVKRFDVLHLRFLLHLQSSLAELQKRLDACDDAETAQLNLSSTRDDNNQERKLIMDKLEQLLPKYDDAVLRFSRMLELSAVSDRNYESVKNWVDGNKPLVRSESSLFLQSVKDGDIIALRDGPRSEGVIANLLERIVPMLPRKAINKLCSTETLQQRSRDPRMFLLKSDRLSNVELALTGIFASFWLVIPACFIHFVSQPITRALIFLVFVLGFSRSVTAVAETTKFEVFASMTTYGAFLNTFFSNPNASSH